jgi:hypothetical protein
MPYSVHVFGNYFIHGIPYYENGVQVSSTYSGGCIRLNNDDAKKVYDFVQEGTPIIVTRDTEHAFDPTPPGSALGFPSMTMTDRMVATISLEALTQDDTILDTDGITPTTRRTALERLLRYGDTAVTHLYVNKEKEPEFLDMMNKKAEALGLSSTHFTDLTSPVTTTSYDMKRFNAYLSTYKSYLVPNISY